MSDIPRIAAPLVRRRSHAEDCRRRLVSDRMRAPSHGASRPTLRAWRFVWSTMVCCRPRQCRCGTRQPWAPTRWQPSPRGRCYGRFGGKVVLSLPILPAVAVFAFAGSVTVAVAGATSQRLPGVRRRAGCGRGRRGSHRLALRRVGRRADRVGPGDSTAHTRGRGRIQGLLDTQSSDVTSRTPDGQRPVTQGRI